MTVKWKFLDLTDNSTATFEINPDSSSSGVSTSSSGTTSYPPTLEKTITTVATLAPGGKTLIYEGADIAPSIGFSGTILTETMYNTMITWFNKRHQIQLTDDLGLVYVIYIVAFAPVRVRMATNAWYHTYSVTAQIVNWS